MTATPQEANAGLADLAQNAGRAEQKLREENEKLRAEMSALLGLGEPSSDPTLDRRRRERKPFGSMDQKLFWPKRAGFHRHWFNDDPGRIDAAKNAGYEHVLKDGKPVSIVVGKFASGQGKVGYLMEIPQDWFDEDMEKNQKKVDETYSSIHRGEVGRGKGDGRYVPPGRISIRDSSR